MSVRPETPRSVRVIEVIETVTLRGLGAWPDPVREVTQYWNFKGILLAEKDPCAELREQQKDAAD